MDELIGTIKTIFFTFIKVYLLILAVTLIFFGPGEAATFVKWSVGITKDAGDSGKTFINEVKK